MNSKIKLNKKSVVPERYQNEYVITRTTLFYCDYLIFNFPLSTVNLPYAALGRAPSLAALSIFSMKIPYPSVGLATKTWVTAPTSLPS